MNILPRAPALNSLFFGMPPNMPGMSTTFQTSQPIVDSSIMDNYGFSPNAPPYNNFPIYNRHPAMTQHMQTSPLQSGQFPSNFLNQMQQQLRRSPVNNYLNINFQPQFQPIKAQTMQPQKARQNGFNDMMPDFSGQGKMNAIFSDGRHLPTNFQNDQVNFRRNSMRKIEENQAIRVSTEDMLSRYVMSATPTNVLASGKVRDRFGGPDERSEQLVEEFHAAED